MSMSLPFQHPAQLLQPDQVPAFPDLEAVAQWAKDHFCYRPPRPDKPNYDLSVYANYSGDCTEYTLLLASILIHSGYQPRYAWFTTPGVRVGHLIPYVEGDEYPGLLIVFNVDEEGAKTYAAESLTEILPLVGHENVEVV